MTPNRAGIAVPNAVCVPCFEFTRDGSRLEKRSVIIAPIVVDEFEPGLYKLSWGCSCGKTCLDEYCRYSKQNFKGSRDQEYNHEPDSRGR